MRIALVSNIMSKIHACTYMYDPIRNIVDDTIIIISYSLSGLSSGQKNLNNLGSTVANLKIFLQHSHFTNAPWLVQYEVK